MYSLDDLRTLMRCLRDPEHGCPWDLKQTYQTIAPHTLEECYELIDAIESGDTEQIRQELGDVLFQVVFYSQLAEEAGDFTFSEVTDAIVSKLLRRHPHVFPEGELDKPTNGRAIDEAEIKRRWEEIKAEERAAKAQNGVLDDIPTALPALKRAQKLQKRAATIGFDWQAVGGVFDKLDEERAELAEAIASGDKDHQAEEMGDLIFVVVNLARHLGLDAETVLRAANRKFEARFQQMEQLSDKSLGELSPATLESLWEQAKKALKNAD
ncbi:ATP diphosphatase [Litorivivens lipolytica]|uniref:Nucleoside triphosphate pyrophosphohydrolase n=1 Tax=Litorivivens lipolytica TaxID=1524264 RepID=A0A7W4Z407_9GAMM|nr:nucleoside triphosphate pyrophosphohydrolase [Litorivivens lipolytica]MBB3046009.1 ATP diphosphatase [Litorivivens lipolytica]